ncbi:MAG: methyltransferase domain-containing protein [Myxococcota bacterium]
MESYESFTATVSAPAPAYRPSPAHRVGETYDELAVGYDDYHVDNKSLAENRFVAGRIAARIDASTSVLDVGCGTGLLLDLIDIPPDRYLGVDVSEGMLQRAKKKHPHHRFVTADAQRMSSDLGRFDLVVSLFGSPSYCALGSFARSVQRVQAPKGGHFLMYCGPRYMKRSTYINKSTKLLKSYASPELREAYPGSRTWGLSFLVDIAPKSLPAPVMRGLLGWDARTVGRLAPDACFFVIVER